MTDYDTAAGVDAGNARDIVNGDGATNGARNRSITVDFKTSLFINDRLDESAKIV